MSKLRLFPNATGEPSGAVPDSAGWYPAANPLLDGFTNNTAPFFGAVIGVDAPIDPPQPNIPLPYTVTRVSNVLRSGGVQAGQTLTLEFRDNGATVATYNLPGPQAAGIIWQTDVGLTFDPFPLISSEWEWIHPFDSNGAQNTNQVLQYNLGDAISSIYQGEVNSAGVGFEPFFSSIDDIGGAGSAEPFLLMPSPIAGTISKIMVRWLIPPDGAHWTITVRLNQADTTAVLNTDGVSMLQSTTVNQALAILDNITLRYHFTGTTGGNSDLIASIYVVIQT